MTTERPRTLLQFELTLLPQKEEFEAACLDALETLNGAVDAILLSLPSWQEAPKALSHPLVVEALARCARLGIDVILGRDVWIRWETLAKANGWKQQPGDVFDRAYYVAYLSRLAAEAEAMGAEGMFAQCEPHGDKTFTAEFKAHGFTDPERRRVVSAILLACDMVPGATIAKPVGSSNPDHYGYATGHIAREHLCTKFDYCHSLSDLLKIVNVPPRYPLMLNWLRTALTSVHNANPGDRLNVPEWNHIDWAEIKRGRPEFLGRVVKAEEPDMVAVMQELGE